jgi:hypothetical protein
MLQLFAFARMDSRKATCVSAVFMPDSFHMKRWPSSIAESAIETAHGRVSFAFFQFGTIWVPLWILIITGSTDAILGNFVEPRIMGKGLGLSPLVVLFSLFFWGWLWGIPGMVLAVPLAAVIRIICQNIPSLKPLAVMMGP